MKVKDNQSNPTIENALLVLKEHGYLKAKTKHFPFLKKLVEQEESFAKLLLSWDPPKKKDEQKIKLIAELHRLNKVIPEGLLGYVKATKKLYQNYNEAAQENTHLKYRTPQKQINLVNVDDNFISSEKIAIKHLDKIVVLLIAGGLGERLGFDDIKLKLPCHQIFSATYLSYYASMIKGLELIFEQNLSAELKGQKKISIPFIIMTSEETDASTKKELEKNDYFQLKKSQIIFIKQSSVPCFEDFAGNFALSDPYSIKLKPSGHGNIHALMYELFKKNKQLKDKKHVFFMQDTNLQVVNVLLSSLGVHLKKKSYFTWIGVNRKAHEKMGLIVEEGRGKTKKIFNLEYNLIEEIDLEKKSQGFLGNTNMFWIDLEVYKKILYRTKGAIESFVNPKLSQDKSKFLVANRKESLMQDIVKDIPEQSKIFVISYLRNFSFSPVKNPLTDLINNPYSKSYTPLQSDEINFKNNRDELIRDSENGNKFLGVERDNTLLLHLFTSNLAKVFLHPYHKIFHDPQKKLGTGFKISGSTFKAKSIFVLNLPLIEIDGLHIHSGAMLVIDGHPEAKLKIKNVEIKNQGYKIIALKKKDYLSSEIPLIDKLFGYQFQEIKPLKIFLKEKGNYLLTEEKKGEKGAREVSLKKI